MTGFRVVQLSSRDGREVVTEVAAGFATISDALDYADEHDPNSTLGLRAERSPEAALFPVGSRVRLRRPVDRYPHFSVDAGAVGEVVHNDGDVVCVRMAEKVAGAESWDNEIVWSPRDGDVVSDDLEVVVKYPAVGCKRGFFVDTASTQVPRGRVSLFYGCTRPDGSPDRTVSASLVAAAGSVEELKERHPEAFELERADLDRLRDRIGDPSLRHDYDVLATVEKDGPSMAGFEAALKVRKDLAADTLAPAWLRRYADEVVEAVRVAY